MWKSHPTAHLSCSAQKATCKKYTTCQAKHKFRTPALGPNRTGMFMIPNTAAELELTTFRGIFPSVADLALTRYRVLDISNVRFSESRGTSLRSASQYIDCQNISNRSALQAYKHPTSITTRMTTSVTWASRHVTVAWLTTDVNRGHQEEWPIDSGRASQWYYRSIIFPLLRLQVNIVLAVQH